MNFELSFICAHVLQFFTAKADLISITNQVAQCAEWKYSSHFTSESFEVMRVHNSRVLYSPKQETATCRPKSLFPTTRLSCTVVVIDELVHKVLGESIVDAFYNRFP